MRETHTGSETVDAFDGFVLARGPALWRTAWLLTGDRQRAEDLVQTALAKAWPHFERVDSFEAYVRRVLLNTYTSWWRRKWTGEVPVAEPDAGQAHHDVTADPDLMAALAQLPRRQRTVLVLRYFEGLSEREIAEQMAISPGTVKSHASRGLESLRTSPLLNLQEL